MPLSRHQFHLGFFKQDADKNEYLLKASETYEPLNVNFVDLYQVRIQFSSETLGSIKKYVHHPNYQITQIFFLQTQTASCSDSKGGLSQSFESGNKSSSSRAASSGRKLSCAKIGHFSSRNAFLRTPLQQFPLISFPASTPSNVFSLKPSKFYT